MASVTTTRPSLSSNDAAVLQALFDAESSPSSGVTIDSTLPAWPAAVHISPEDLISLKEREVEIVRQLQETPSHDTVKAAIQKFDSLLSQYSTYPSAYINRAQALRMLDDALFTPKTADISSKIFADLSKAITLATPVSPADSVSSVQARLLADAHTHRGYLLLKAARMQKEILGDKTERTLPDSLAKLEPDQIEEMASRDFFFGGRYGNKVAQQLAVQTNPYAKMCGAIVKEAMRKEIHG
ncbi:hypothetical protein N7478_006049 [Penicillium angulare]|uniref:uncharacterized protein n=1 Tax=Penicillium angulare TaxID=116970 RepID=UPI00254213FF|nr:uncharacterized protein N7478_006049 [Penicillium angulare]KAJ5280677.1 hypothetical protein N7478_006049 [Penicillium angulare]